MKLVPMAINESACKYEIINGEVVRKNINTTVMN
jgi:hypothetical protein